MAAQVTITGRLGRDPEIKQAGANQVAELSIASTHRAKVDGEWQEITTWYRATVWDASSRGTVERFASKGSYVIVSGSLEPRTYKDKTGAERLSLEIRASSVEVPRMGDGAGKPAPTKAASDATYQRDTSPPSDDDLPF